MIQAISDLFVEEEDVRRQRPYLFKMCVAVLFAGGALLHFLYGQAEDNHN